MEERNFYISVWLGSLPVAKFKVQFPVICCYYSACLIGQDRSMQPEVIFPDFWHFSRYEWRVAEALKLRRVFLTPTPSMLSFSPLVQPLSLPPSPPSAHIPCCCQFRIWMTFILIVSLCKHCVASLMQPEESYWFTECEGYLDWYPSGIVITLSSPLRIMVNLSILGEGHGNEFPLPC